MSSEKPITVTLHSLQDTKQRTQRVPETQEIAQVQCKTVNEQQVIDRLKKRFKAVFDESTVGRMNNAACKIRLKPGAEPVQHPMRKIAFAILPAVKKELERMESLGVIAKVDEPTPWVNSMVVVKQPGKLRICLDPTDLNKFVMREHSYIPTPEETLAKITNAKFFSKLDLKSGYWQLCLDEESSYKTTFNSPCGRFRYLRLPFGLNSANEIFQKKMTEKFEGYEGVLVIFDDILVFAETFDEHVKRLQRVLERCEEVGIKLNEKKCHFLCKEVKYIGHVITPEGVKPDPEKIKAITEMPPPTDKKGVQRLLGMITYLGRYISNLSEMTHPLRILLHKQNEFVWTHEQDKAFTDIKEALTSDAVLTHYDVHKPAEVHTDACQHGLGACLMQDGRPVAYASRSLTETERNYANIEKELLSVVFGLERFNQYVYGKHTTVYSDHRPLVPISTKPIYANPARCQRLLLRLQKYDYYLIYKPGKIHFIPDTLSRAPVSCTDHDVLLERECELNVHLILECFKSSDMMKSKLRTETKLDTCLSKIMDYIKIGWPDENKKCDPSVSMYWCIKDQLSISDDFVIYENRIVIPKKLQPEILSRLHDSHQGRVRSKALARQGVYWRNINSDIDNLVDKCELCLKARKLPDKIELKSHAVPTRPFEKIGADIVTVSGSKYQVVVDYFSKWIEIEKLPNNPRSCDLIEHFKSIFSRFGIPEIVFSDREPVYKSDKMKLFCKDLNIDKEFSSAMHSQSNGQVERAIGHVKKIIIRCKGNMTDIRMNLLDYYSTPLDSNLGSPHNILMNRNVRTRVPCLTKNLVTESDIRNRKLLQERQLKQAKYYDRDAKKSFVKFKPGDIVVYKNNSADKNWKQAKVISADLEFRSYTLLNCKGNLITRNRAMMLPDKTGKGFHISPDQLFDSVQNPNPNETPKITQEHVPQPARCKSQNSSTPAQIKARAPDLVVPKTTMTPDQVKEMKLHNYASRHNVRVLPKSQSLSKSVEKSMSKHVSKRSELAGTATVPVRRSERIAAKMKTNP